MTQSFREEFNNVRLAAANKFLGDLADNFKERINSETLLNPTSENAYVAFQDSSLRKVSRKELLGLDGFIRLRKICADPAIDMALGHTVYELTKRPDYEAHSLCVHVAKPYAASGFLQAEKEWQKQEEAQQKKNRPGILRRAFARLRNRREMPVGAVIGYNEVSSRRPVARVVTEPLTSPPSLN